MVGRGGGVKGEGAIGTHNKIAINGLGPTLRGPAEITQQSRISGPKRVGKRKQKIIRELEETILLFCWYLKKSIAKIKLLQSKGMCVQKDHIERNQG